MPVTAAEAAQEVAAWHRSMNGGRVLPPTLSRLRRLQQEETFPICNVGPWPYRIERGSISVFIPAYDAKADTQKLGYSKSEPMPEVRREAKIISEDEYSYFEDDGRQVALDMIGIGFGLRRQSALDQYGVFVPAGSEPTHEEIQEAKGKLSLCIDRLIEEARDAYDKGPAERKATIDPDRHLWAARQRGINEPWVHHQHTQENTQCTMCGKFNPQGIAMCQCGNILDMPLYAKLKANQKKQLEELELEEATKPHKK